MSFFYAIHLQKKQRRRLVYLLSLIAGLFIFLSLNFSNILPFQAKQTALIKGNPDEKQIALTFNISWGDEKVLDILEVLKQHQLRASFFVSGEWAERHPQIIELITEGKHELAMLGYRYKNYLDQEIDQVRKDMVYAQQLFQKLGYPDIRYIRPPSGLFNKEIIDLAKSLQLDVVHWSIATDDWKNPGVEAIVTEATKASNGDIILLHASDAAKQTAQALPKIIQHFQTEGFDFLTISELYDGVQSEESIVE